MPTNGAGSNNNGPINNGPVHGDILNALSGDVRIIRNDTSAIRLNTNALASMDQNISAILQNVGRWSQQDVRSRIYDNENPAWNGRPNPYTDTQSQRERNSNRHYNRWNRGDDWNYRDRWDDYRWGPSNWNRGRWSRNNRNQDARYDENNPNQHNSEYRVTGRPFDDFLDTFFGELEKNILGGDFRNIMQQNMKEFASAMGLEVEELPSAFGKALADRIKRSQIGQNITDRIHERVDTFISHTFENMRQGINTYYDMVTQAGEQTPENANDERSRWDQILDRIEARFRNRIDNTEAQPNPAGPTPGMSAPDGSDINGPTQGGPDSPTLSPPPPPPPPSPSSPHPAAPSSPHPSSPTEPFQYSPQPESPDFNSTESTSYTPPQYEESSTDNITTEGDRWDEFIDRVTDNFRNRRTTADNDPTPGGIDDGGSPPIPPTSSVPDEDTGPNEGDFERNKILEDKLNYLYTLNNTLNTINEGVKLIADNVGADESALSRLTDIFNRNNDRNDDFINSLLTQSQGGGGGNLLGSMLADSGVQTELTALADMIAAGSLDIGAGLAGLAAAALPVAAAFCAINAALWVLDQAIKGFQNCFKPLQDSFGDLIDTYHKARNRYFIDAHQKIKDQRSRLEQDVDRLIRSPFEIMDAAAKEWYTAWDNNLKTINATQGYTKADLQNLMANYAERLRANDLETVVSAADISTNLSKVLESGLSGVAAEEFAYLATVLQNAIPTQDFFGYASTYASIAANQIAMGKSQAQAIEAANEQLTQFANTLLYSSRELAGGFATGLSNASNLLDNAVKIANTAGLADSSYISAALTAISASVGAIAPDLASNISDAIVDAALGGNTDELVALRSLADTGASNTAFLMAFAKNPKQVLSTLFTNLSEMQNINNDNFMEVAESLASTFGLSIGAFTRLDFKTLASTIANIDLSLQPLQKNMDLLKEGQTTTTAEQLKLAEINKIILNEGLSYVLDNEEARAIQEHMWQQELAAQIQETTYAVDIEGKALDFLQSIKETINNILKFLNPFSWIGGIFDVAEVAKENKALKADIKAVLEAGKVGQGNRESLYNLTTYDVDRLTNVPGNLAELMTGVTSQFRELREADRETRAVLSLGLESSLADNIANAWHSFSNRFLPNNTPEETPQQEAELAEPPVFDTTPYEAQDVNSRYTFATKGLYNALSQIRFNTQPADTATAELTANTISAQAQITSQSEDNLQSFIDTMQDSVKENQSFDEWMITAQKYNIRELDRALDEFGFTLTDLEGKYQEYQAAQKTAYESERNAKEEQLWARMTRFMDQDMLQTLDGVETRLDIQIEFLTAIDSTLTAFLTSWRTDWLQNAWSIDWLQTAWNTDWIQSAWRTDWLQNAWQANWLDKAWNGSWLQSAWRNEWLQNAWKRDWIQNAWHNAWLDQAWRSEWLDSAWRNEWINQAWRNEWIQNAWFKYWIQDAWQNSWLNDAWGSNWLDQAWRTEWIQNAWRTEWLENAWKGIWDTWRTEWLEKAWKQDWIQGAWSRDWLKTAWESAWLNQAWNKKWIEESWKQDWIQNAWSTAWLATAWTKGWLQDAWQDAWLGTAWNSNWLQDAWQASWIDNAWTKQWVNDIFRKRFIDDILTMLWGNRWWEFFNIFKDRFGGITTAENDGLTSGLTTIDTEGLYRIYTEETGKAADNALTEVEQSDETGDAILALTKELTKNTVDLRDPQVQTNVLLSQILIVLEAIMQASNVSGSAALATTLSALGMGLETQTISSTTNGAVAL